MLQEILHEVRRQGVAIERLESRFDAADSKANREADHLDLGLDYHKVNEMLEDIRSLRIRSKSRQAGMRWRFRRLIRSTGRISTAKGQLRRPSFWRSNCESESSFNLKKQATQSQTPHLSIAASFEQADLEQLEAEEAPPGSGCLNTALYKCSRHAQIVSKALPMLHPNGLPRICWNSLIMILVVASSITVPLQVAFETDMAMIPGMPDVWDGLDTTFDILFLLDIVVNFRTGYMDRGLFVTDTYLVAENYVRSNFVLDLVSSMLADIIDHACLTATTHCSPLSGHR